ncbi:hypothetical protein ACO1O0_003788 [Amphichorda felina]
MAPTMQSGVVFDDNLTRADVLVLQNLEADISDCLLGAGSNGHGNGNTAKNATPSLAVKKNPEQAQDRDESTLAALEALNDPKDAHFEPTVFNNVDLSTLTLHPTVQKWILNPYLRVARSIVRVETDIVMLTHLLLYFSTSVPSALFLFWRFSWVHGILHAIMQVSYMGTYTLMMHQHIHMRGILNRRLAIFDHVFPYITDPLMGHTWNSYFYHHVKHHHVEGNGPDDLSSTLRYQRDNIFHFLHYVGRFYVLIWLDLPTYFFRKGRATIAMKAAFWELSMYYTVYTLFRLNSRATICVVLIPLLLMRAGLMVGNWGQHAFVDHDEPDSDYRSSITLIDSNRHCFNDGYHTSHHLNPLRHWREHPAAFIKGKTLYAKQHALVFHNIDYLMITVRLMLKDYKTLAKCMVPIGDQISMTLDERAELLKSHTRRFTEEDLRKKFRTP